MTTLVFVHGMYMTPRCWDLWLAHFRAKGYDCHAPAWPLHDGDPTEIRSKHPDPALGALTLTQVVAHYEKFLDSLPEKAVLIGHSMGGLISQLLVAKGRAKAAVLIDSAAPTGVTFLSWSFLKSNWPVVSPFVSESEAFLPNEQQFAYAFAHTLEAAALHELYNLQVVPESRRVGRGPLGKEGALDFAKPHVPLFFVSGELDHIIPAGLNRANFKKYRDANSIREQKTYPNRTHSIMLQEGWQEVAADVEAFVTKHGT